MSAEVATTFRDAATLNQVQALYAVDIAMKQFRVDAVDTWLPLAFAHAWLCQAGALRCLTEKAERNSQPRQ